MKIEDKAAWYTALKTYKTHVKCEAMQWLPDNTALRENFLAELQQLSVYFEQHGGHPIYYEIINSPCDVKSCLELGYCNYNRPPVHSLEITYDLTRNVLLYPGWWLIYNPELKDWMYAETDEDFREEYQLTT